ncbi:hypothetical protein BD410DRAFT_282793 [Rickenella mellea]|uniref:Uncharacterized protein n=1 Tax=Rickenella mellea TaxID=50990 RepID=A0A4Y7Q4N3_9AGAM|nr:hypothetical protein BD410DRAFT_282793 [Rickenella mellea]
MEVTIAAHTQSQDVVHLLAFPCIPPFPTDWPCRRSLRMIPPNVCTDHTYPAHDHVYTDAILLSFASHLPHVGMDSLFKHASGKWQILRQLFKSSCRYFMKIMMETLRTTAFFYFPCCIFVFGLSNIRKRASCTHCVSRVPLDARHSGQNRPFNFLSVRTSTGDRSMIRGRTRG